MSDDQWSVYIVTCRDGSLYCGISNDVAARIEKHNAGRGARYTRSRLPVTLVYVKPCGSRADAMGREAAIKRQKRSQKLELIEQFRKEMACA